MNLDEVIEKIKKAVRLASKTTSESERDTAMRLARNLAAKSGVAFEEIAEEANLDAAVMVDDEREKTATGSEVGLSFGILRNHFGVIVMMTRRTNKRWKPRLSWIGSRLNIDIARYVYDILIRESRRAWREAQKAIASEPLVELNRHSFMRGFFFAIHKKLAANPLRNDLESSIRAAERRLLAFEQESGKGVKMSKAGKGKVTDANALAAGYDAGSAVNLSRPCEGRTGAAAALGHEVRLLTA